ncbi:molybdate ABC transporter substrate-binding protein [Pelomonas sp. SE-A7]|uniref:molybdate ABC transporter substrate-binding protein n=1 Tax=Pelomonas sp. SE-A7 TaxID=3054953 RepID=UPI00259D1B5B|nr:molybdate ABC transporter substrate-binding protein [Pelomonas sp. SE-A7]MDM4765189.1 molybdate ABC transporter substrate-binding protein [Pelomonas sp. SE-A7]
MSASPSPVLRGLASLLLSLAGVAASAADLTVSAAASLSNAFRELAPAFEAQHPGTRLQFNFAASDALLAQISKGAPVDVFASADQETMDKAEAQKLLQAGSRRNFVSNSLVLVVPAASALAVSGLADLQKPEVTRIAIGKPEGVPAGRYAKGALEAAKLWSVVEPKAIYAVNVRQALDYVARAEVEAGFVYATDAAIQKDKVKVVATIPTETAIAYPIAAVTAAPNAEAARKFIDYVASPAGQAVLARYGFLKP